MSCRNESVALACFTDGGGNRSSVFANHVYDADGALLALYYTDAAGATVDTSVGTVVAGACAVASPDVEFTVLCDIQADGSSVPFVCRTVTNFDASGNVVEPVVVANFQMDKVTAYIPTGTVGNCGDSCPDETALGLISDTSAL